MNQEVVESTEVVKIPEGVVTENDANSSAQFFSTNIKLYKEMLNNLSKKELKRILYAVTVHPLQEEHESIITSKMEEDVVNLQLALMNAKLMMFSFYQENKQTQVEEKTDGTETTQE